MDALFILIFLVVWIALGKIEDDENESAREWARVVLIAVGLCWLIVRSGLISI